MVDGEKLSAVMSDIKDWMYLKHLTLNPYKTEGLVVGKKTNLRRLNISSLRVHGSTLDAKNEVTDLGSVTIIFFFF